MITLARSLPGFDPNLRRATRCRTTRSGLGGSGAQADAISPWSGRHAIAYNADAGHQDWVDAVQQHQERVSIDAWPRRSPPSPLHPDHRPRHRQCISRWMAGDHPSMIELLSPAVHRRLDPTTSAATSTRNSTRRWPPPKPPHVNRIPRAVNDAHANPVSRHASRAALGLHQCRMVVASQQRHCHLEWFARTTRTSSA